MRYPSSDNARVDRAMESFFDAIGSYSGKEAAAMAGASEATAAKWRARHIQDPMARPFVRFLIRSLRLSDGNAAKILAPILGDEVHNVVRLSAMASSLKELARHVEEISRDNRAGRDGVRALLGLGSAPGAGVAAEPAGLGSDRTGGAGDGAGRADQALSLVQVRRSLDRIAGRDGEALRRHLTANVYSLDAARAYKAKHRNVGLAWKPPGLDWIVDPAADNRLWTGEAGPRPLTRFPAPQHVESLRRGFEEAARSIEPIVLEHTGFNAGEHIHALVGRKGGVSNDGVEMCLAAFERRTA